jgi:acetyl-CoA carboxylase biotin carboxylase subunit
MKTCKKLGIVTVAVYSDADRAAMHVRIADEAYHIGASQSNQSYLNGQKVIEVAKNTGCQAIHPGYGFLSENADFADMVKANNLIFIGPEGSSMRQMGAKIEAKLTAKKANVPLVPGTEEKIQDISLAKRIAGEIGFPVLIKASAGGGGKGMRIVHSESTFEQEVDRAMSEALSAFGDGSVFIEKYINAPKHIEIQILADRHGNVVYLNERECSVQRRHQKLVEEAPSPVIDDKLRKKIGMAAVELAKSCNYIGAGTVEFLLDEQRNFYFLEMNTRLQVEHPVTEFITGIDLVEWQIRVADNEPLDFRQEDVKLIGHAMELRVCAEDPTNNFLPSTGILTTYIEPEMDGVRVDSGFEEGDQIPIFYDSMIAKLIVHAPNRTAAISKLHQAINGYQIVGIPTTLEFGQFTINHPTFIDGSFDTKFVDQYFSPEKLNEYKTTDAAIASLAAIFRYKQKEKSITIPSDKPL